jgi:glycine hydroxymethyltransferase
VTSGLRFGTPGISSRGMGVEEVKMIAGWIDQILSKPVDPSIQRWVREKVKNLCRRFPLRDRLEG